MKIYQFLLITTTAAIAAPETLDRTIVKSDPEPTLTQPTLEQDKLELAKIPGGTETVDSERYLTGRSSTFADTFSSRRGSSRNRGSAPTKRGSRSAAPASSAPSTGAASGSYRTASR